MIEYMNKILLTIKIITIVLVVIIFYVVMHKNMVYIVRDDFVDYNNQFKYKPANTRIQYTNVGDLPWNRHSISSSIPYDVKVKAEVENAYYYEYDNKSYNEKLKAAFKSNCQELIIATDGSRWSKWLNPKNIKDDDEINKVVDYYNKIFKFIALTLNASKELELPSYDDKKEIQIVHDILLRVRYNLDDLSYYMFNIDMILYRESKLQGKHVKFVAVTNGVNVNIILARIIGVVSEDNIALHPYTAVDNSNKLDFDIFIPIKASEIDAETKNSKENTFQVKDEYVDSEIETILYKKLLDEYNEEDVDIMNNNYIPKKEELVKKSECYL
jgi:hypothetical protein